jgi:hypothetical protein
MLGRVDVRSFVIRMTFDPSSLFVSRCGFCSAMLRWVEPGTPTSGGNMVNPTERRASRRFTMTLPLKVRANGPDGGIERQGQTRDVSFRGLYFLIDADFENGSSIEFVLTLPREITLAGDVHIRCFAQIIRVEPHNGRKGVAARIDRYEFLPAAAPA